jgi:hypothetical protein
MLGCYILCSESLVEEDRLMVKVVVDQQQSSLRWIDSNSKFEVVDWVKLKLKISMTSQPTRGRSAGMRRPTRDQMKADW